MARIRGNGSNRFEPRRNRNAPPDRAAQTRRIEPRPQSASSGMSVAQRRELYRDRAVANGREIRQAPTPRVHPNADRLQRVGSDIGRVQERINQAIQNEDLEGARSAIQDGMRLARDGASIARDMPEVREQFEAAEAAFSEVQRELDAAENDAREAVEAEEASRGGGPLGFLRGAVDTVTDFVGNVAGRVGDFLSPVGELLAPVGRVIGGVRDAIENVGAAVGDALINAREAIDSTIGQVPVIGQAVRFTTGLATSVVGLVGGVGQAILHPVEMVQGLAQVGGRLAMSTPPLLLARVANDYLIDGIPPHESIRNAGNDVLQIGQALFSGAITEFQNGNVAGALGRLTGDIGSMFVGGAGAARLAGWSSRLGRFQRAGQIAFNVLRADELLIAGAGRAAGAARVGNTLADVGRAASDGFSHAADLRAAQVAESATAVSRVADPAALRALGDRLQALDADGLARVYDQIGDPALRQAFDQQILRPWTEDITPFSSPLHGEYRRAVLEGQPPANARETLFQEAAATRRDRWERLAEREGVTVPDVFDAYRGVRGDDFAADVVRAWLDDSATVIPARHNELTSWSLDADLARDVFSRGFGRQADEAAVIWRAEIPFEQTIADSWVDGGSFFNRIQEQEIIAAAGADSIRVPREGAQVRWGDRFYSFEERGALFEAMRANPDLPPSLRELVGPLP